jgi:hypothetical protein
MKKKLSYNARNGKYKKNLKPSSIQPDTPAVHPALQIYMPPLASRKQSKTTSKKMHYIIFNYYFLERGSFNYLFTVG